ncbi:MAG: ATP-binding cassette domain-containing protein [Tissierellia bacterium]|nr:ATP-binding cassette domain-containing protein [Tissierellia bacterium]
MKEVVNKVGLYDFVNKLPSGYDTNLGKIYEQGIEISGGEWQKIAIARSIVSNAPVKILDEPTSSLDPISENKLYKQFKDISYKNTAIFISHRLGSTKLADEIFVFDKGVIVEKGNHKKLMKLDGIYSKMFSEQRKWYI